LPDDPPGLVHHTGCLVEAVLPAEWQEAEGDSLEGRHLPLTPPLQAQQAAWSSQCPHDMVVRLTVFAAGERRIEEGGGRRGRLPFGLAVATAAAANPSLLVPGRAIGWVLNAHCCCCCTLANPCPCQAHPF